MEFCKIDGSYGEGGGQILRSAVTLSCIAKIPVKIEKIRYNRKNPGLSAQHLTAVKILSKICNAKVSGLRIGSTELEFCPNDMCSVSLTEDVGTAGSISLILQVLINAVSLSRKSLEITMRGGTDVPWSPTIDYTKFVLADALSRFGIKYSVGVNKRGYYPKGGGVVHVKIRPCDKITPILLTNRDTKNVRLHCTYSKISEQRIKDALLCTVQDFEKNGFDAHVEFLTEKGLDGGASILAYSNDKSSVIGADSLWDVYKDSFAKSFGRFVSNGLGADENLADMLVVPASQSSGTSVFRVQSITKHLETNLYVASKITGCKYGIGKVSGGYEIRMRGRS